MKISVSYLSSNNIIEDLRKLNVTDLDYIHVDVMDGKFVKNKTMSFSELKEIHRYTNKRLDVHLMVKKPIKYIDDYATLNTEFITIHIEAEKIDKTLKKIDDYGIKKGLSIKPNTSLQELVPYLNNIDLILVMSVEPGKGGQAFIDNTIDRIKELKELLNKHNSKVLISVDGGINDEIAKKLKDVDILVSGSYVLSGEDYNSQIDSLRKNNKM